MPYVIRLALVIVLGVATTGCIVEQSGPPPGGAGGGGGGPVLDAPQPLGVAQLMGYHVAANSSAELPANARGFAVTADGSGGYRLSWSDVSDSTSVFSGSITTDGTFDPAQLHGLSGAEATTLGEDGAITFSSEPGTNLDGVDLVSSTDPIYVDARIDGVRAGFLIYFTGAQSGAQLASDYNPVAFTSP
jgi:hypothetical protein